MRLRIGGWRVIYTEDLVVLLVLSVAPADRHMNEAMAMSYEPQTFSAPDGTEMVVLPAAEYARLKSLAEEGEEVGDAQKALARIEAGEGTVPGEVLNMILDEGLHPIAAWRRYRGLSQAGLARKAKLSQVWISRIERGGGYGSRRTRRKLAEALEAPAWALEDSRHDDVD